MKNKFLMKKEIFVGSFLLLMLAAAIINIHFLVKLTDNVSNMIEEAKNDASSGNWDQASEKAEEASRLWEGSDTYTHLVLRHTELEEATNSIYGFIEKIYAKEEGAARGAAEAAIARLKSISSIEQIRLGSIF